MAYRWALEPCPRESTPLLRATINMVVLARIEAKADQLPKDAH